MLLAAPAPSSDGKGSSFFNYEQQVGIWRQVTNLGPKKWASALILQMDTATCQVCVDGEGGVTMGGDGADQISNISRGCVAPGTDGPVCQAVARLLRNSRTDQTTDVFWLEVDVLRREAEFETQLGGAPPEPFAPALCMRNAD